MTIIGEYTGYVKEYSNQDYSWAYKSTINGKQLVIDSLKGGNLLRFVNDLDNHNVIELYLPVNNIWRLFFISSKEI